ncbi:ATP-binding protein [Streptomyces minutiscleroticus]|uniref:ATP-binding protein n=1 Tax=Streptomyces minutiscleroticus TaxID=68238 RepID=A0A918NU43_9ACTN|nr:ATP-binding protein [Streptomyces minutiscleroticus]GGX96413.1 ATP-binding protein [Streptomyces minutiscleroticus]
MEPVSREEDSVPGVTPPEVTASLDGDGGCIAQARDLATEFLTRVQGEYGLPVSARAMDLTQLVVSELVTNALKYAPGPILLQLRIWVDLIEVTIWDSNPVLPMARVADPGRVGQHGLEIVMAVVESFQAHRGPTGKRITARIALLDGLD